MKGGRDERRAINKITKNEEQDGMTKYNDVKIKENDGEQGREQGDSREKKGEIREDKRCGRGGEGGGHDMQGCKEGERQREKKEGG